MIGRDTPRLFTPPLRELTPETSKGFEVIEFARDELGVDLMPWQRFVLIHGLELREGGGYRFRTVVVLVGRQNGKTTLLRVLAPWRMLRDQARLVLGTSTTSDMAAEAWEGSIELLEESGLAGQIGRIRRANGEQQLVLANRARYKIAAANRRGGRSLSVDLGIADELREHQNWEAMAALDGTMTATPDPQLWALSNAGDNSSVVLNSMRDAALGVISSGEGDDSLGLFEWSAPDGCDLDDWDAIAQANPGLGYTITEATLVSKRGKLPPNVYRTEHLCQRVATLDAAIPGDGWADGADPEATLDELRGRVAVCLDVAPDLEHVTLVAAAVTDDGRVRVEVVDAWESTADARADLPGWLERVKPRAFGWFPGGPAAALAADLRGVKNGTEIKAAEVGAVCQGLAEQVTARRILHRNDPLLTAQIAGASKLYSGDGWRFTRKGTGHCDAVYALAGALHLARTLPPLRKLRILAPSAIAG